MFSNRFDALMNIAEVTNSMLGRAVNMNSSHIGRLRSGIRPLPKKHEYLMPMCQYIAGRITKDYQTIALQKLTGIPNNALETVEGMANYIEVWLLEHEQNTLSATGKLISNFSRLSLKSLSMPSHEINTSAPQKYSSYLYGDEGKRRAVEQLFLMVLQEDKPQTLLLYSDENMAWLYEDKAYATRWAELFTSVLLKGNRVRIIHTISRDMNELLEAITKWIPIYITGKIEPYCYPRLRDGIFRQTMFIAPRTAAVVASSVQQNTEGMLNLFLTDKTALNALVTEYNRYFALCRPLMQVFSGQDADNFIKTLSNLVTVEGDTILYSAMPPLFCMPEKLVQELSEQTGNELLLPLWKRSYATFRKNIKKQRLSLALLDPELALLMPQNLHMPLSELVGLKALPYTETQYLLQISRLKHLASQYENFSIIFHKDLAVKLLLYVKEDAGAIMAKEDSPMTAFVISEQNMINAFWDYLARFTIL